MRSVIESRQYNDLRAKLLRLYTEYDWGKLTNKSFHTPASVNGEDFYIGKLESPTLFTNSDDAASGKNFASSVTKRRGARRTTKHLNFNISDSGSPQLDSNDDFFSCQFGSPSQLTSEPLTPEDKENCFPNSTLTESANMSAGSLAASISNVAITNDANDASDSGRIPACRPMSVLMMEQTITATRSSLSTKIASTPPALLCTPIASSLSILATPSSRKFIIALESESDSDVSRCDSNASPSDKSTSIIYTDEFPESRPRLHPLPSTNAIETSISSLISIDRSNDKIGNQNFSSSNDSMHSPTLCNLSVTDSGTNQSRHEAAHTVSRRRSSTADSQWDSPEVEAVSSPPRQLTRLTRHTPYRSDTKKYAAVATSASTVTVTAKIRQPGPSDMQQGYSQEELCEEEELLPESLEDPADSYRQSRSQAYSQTLSRLDSLNFDSDEDEDESHEEYGEEDSFIDNNDDVDMDSFIDNDDDVDMEEYDDVGEEDECEDDDSDVAVDEDSNNDEAEYDDYDDVVNNNLHKDASNKESKNYDSDTSDSTGGVTTGVLMFTPLPKPQKVKDATQKLNVDHKLSSTQAHVGEDDPLGIPSALSQPQYVYHSL